MRHRLRTKVTRTGFEKALGGEFEPALGNPGRRTNGRWTTFKDWSKEAPQRLDCFCRNLTSNTVISGKSWDELHKRLEAKQ